MQVDPYLNFDGDCEEAFNFYEQCFGGKIEFKMTHGESPMAAQFPDWASKIMAYFVADGRQGGDGL